MYLPIASQKRAEKALKMLMANNSEVLGSRAYDDCFEMGDGKTVIISLMNLVKQHKEKWGTDILENYPASNYAAKDQWEKTWKENAL